MSVCCLVGDIKFKTLVCSQNLSDTFCTDRYSLIPVCCLVRDMFETLVFSQSLGDTGILSVCTDRYLLMSVCCLVRAMFQTLVLSQSLGDIDIRSVYTDTSPFTVTVSSQPELTSSQSLSRQAYDKCQSAFKCTV